MKCMEESLQYQNQGENLAIHAFCVMGNHFHQSISYRNGSAKLSKFMRYCHGLFGARYNKIMNRSGKVAEGRPKTPRLQSDDFEARRLHFYIEANPIRAKIVKLQELRYYVYSSYGFYAFGIKTRFTKLLSLPTWYIALGKTPRQRRLKYRELFEKYLEAPEKIEKNFFLKKAIGTVDWMYDFHLEIKRRIKAFQLPTPDPSPTISSA